MRYEWRVISFDESVPIDSLTLTLESDDPRTAALVEQAADAWGVELERVGGWGVVFVEGGMIEQPSKRRKRLE